VSSLPATDRDGDGDIDGDDAAPARSGDGTGPGAATGSSSGSGRTDRDRTGGGGGGASTRRGRGGGGATAGVLVPVDATVGGSSQVHFSISSRIKVAIGTRVAVTVSVPARRISRTMWARIVDLPGGKLVLEFELGQRVKLARTADDPGPIFEPGFRIVFDR
jgi:hypothetical protein